MSAAERGASEDDSVRGDALELARILDRTVPILQLAPHRKQLPGLAGAGPEVPVIEHQASVAGGSETLGDVS